MEFYITAALGLFAVITLGSPVSEADMVGRDIEDRAAAPFLRFYDKINQNVPIGNFDFPDELDNKCVNMPENIKSHANSVGFHGPRLCTFHRDSNCHGVNQAAGGDTNLRILLRDNLRSVKCVL